MEHRRRGDLRIGQTESAQLVRTGGRGAATIIILQPPLSISSARDSLRPEFSKTLFDKSVESGFALICGEVCPLAGNVFLDFIVELVFERRGAAVSRRGLSVR